MSTPEPMEGLHPELRELREQQARPRSKGGGWSAEQYRRHAERMARIRATEAAWEAEKQRLQFLPLEDLVQELYERAAVGALAYFAETPKPVTIVRLWGAVPLAEAAYRAWCHTLLGPAQRQWGDPFQEPLWGHVKARKDHDAWHVAEHPYYWQVRELERRAGVLRLVVGRGLSRAGYVHKGLESAQRGLKYLLEQERARAYGWTRDV